MSAHTTRLLLGGGTREVAVHELTDAGRVEPDRLMRSSLEAVDPNDSVAFSLLQLLDTEVAVASLETRRRSLEEVIAQFPDAGTTTATRTGAGSRPLTIRGGR